MPLDKINKISINNEIRKPETKLKHEVEELFVFDKQEEGGAAESIARIGNEAVEEGVSAEDFYGKDVVEKAKKIFTEGISAEDFYGKDVVEKAKKIFTEGISAEDFYGK